MKRQHTKRGFTLVELLVSLVAGLIISLAMFAISKDATETFHEESRMATTEMTLRFAIERVRTDFMRTSFMSSPNIWTDHQLAYPVSQLRVPAAAPQALQQLSGLRQIVADPSIQGLSIINGFWGVPSAPVGVEITGNMTSADVFPVRKVEPGGTCGGQQVTLQTDTPSMWRILGGFSPQDTLRGLFQPVAQQQFLVRLVDTTGKVQFAPLCPGNAVNVAGGGAAAIITVDVQNASVKFFTTAETNGNGGIAGLCSGCTLNPVHTIRYEIRKLDPNGNPGDAAYAAMQPTLGLGATEKYDLVRTWRDLSGAQIGPTEVVAEYAVDFKLAFTSDLNDVTTMVRPLTTYGFEDPGGGNVTIANVVGLGNPTARPQRIRSARVRLTTRAAIADRFDPLSAPPANVLQGAYPFRYCLKTNGCPVQNPPADQWARLRTTITEISLANQAKSFD